MRNWFAERGSSAQGRTDDELDGLGRPVPLASHSALHAAGATVYDSDGMPIMAGTSEQPPSRWEPTPAVPQR